MQPITLTVNATQDNLTEDDYREIYQELRDNKGLRKLVEMIDSNFSYGMWNKYERGEAELNRTMRNELRQAVDLPLLSPTVIEAISHVSPDAQVVSVTDAESPDRLILAFSGDEPKNILLNGEIAVSGRVTEVTREVKRKPSFRPRLDVEHRDLSAQIINEILAEWKEKKGRNQ